MTHDDLVRRAVAWLRRPCSKRTPATFAPSIKVDWRKPGCGVVVPELVAWIGEIPDAIGWCQNGYSYAVECKASRGDFLAERKRKPRARIEGHPSVGAERFYLCPCGLLEPIEIPETWGLLYANGRSISIELLPRGNPNRDLAGELALMYSLLRRVEVRGQLTACLSPKWGGSGDPRAA